MESSIHERLQKIANRYPIDEKLVFGLDVGIASIGSSVVRHGKAPTIDFAGSRCFDPSEEPKRRTLKNKTRREKRLSRRLTRRRAGRMASIRALLCDVGLLATADPAAFHNRKGVQPIDPWQARAAGLDRLLTNEELAAAILHIAKHRGFKSNKKSDRAKNAPEDDKKMLGAIAENQELLAKYRTAGELGTKSEKFNKHKRNKGGEYTHTFSRADLEYESEIIFRSQRELGNRAATESLYKRYAAIAFHQRPLQDSEGLVSFCHFEESEKRSSRHAPSFELFRFLAKLNTIKVREGDDTLRHLNQEELGKAVSDFGHSRKSVTWNTLSKKIGLPNGVFFDNIDQKKAKMDVSSPKGSAAGTKTLYDTLGPSGWNAVRHNIALLDKVSAIIAFRDDVESIEKGLSSLDGLEPLIISALMRGVREGDFSDFKGAGHISAKAARNILPFLQEGMVYSKATAEAGYDHTQSRKITIEDIHNPVVKRSLREAAKQVETLVHQFNARPGRIIVELAREVGKSSEERDKMTSGLEKRAAERKRHRADLKDKLGLHHDPTDEELRRFELWKEQNYRCIYTDESISPPDILSNATQVDHILPRSRSQDNSFGNQVLCYAKANQDKGQRTPYEWKVRDENDKLWWTSFEARVKALKTKGIKKRNLLMPNFDERARGFVERNLNDTKYAARALLTLLRELYDDSNEPRPESIGYLGTKRRLFARSGTITAILRRAWGLGRMKDRSDDRHHALDALICAAARSEWLLSNLTRQYQEVEQENRAKWTPSVPMPWVNFREDAIAAYEAVFVSRSEKRRGRGQGHKDTIYRTGLEGQRKVTFERKAVIQLTKSDLSRLKDAESGNKPIAISLAAWFEKGKPPEDLPKSRKGDLIRKVLLQRSSTSGFDLKGGHVDNGDMVRIDVFVSPNKSGKNEFYLVPIYRHQVMHRRKWPNPPNQAITRGRAENEWEKVGSKHRFVFSVSLDAYLEIVKSDGSIEAGYFRGANRNTNSITLSPHNFRKESNGSIGVKTALAIRKFNVDRLGLRHEIKQETRTWHGAACT